MRKRRLLAVFLLCALVACSKQDKHELLQSALEQKQAGNYRGATVFLKQALELDANFFEARYQLGDVFLAVRRYQQAEHEFEKVLHQNPDYADLALKLGEVYRQTERPERTVEILKAYHRNHTATTDSLDLLGVALAMQHDYASAEQVLLQSSALDAGNPSPRFHHAQTLLASARADEAVELLTTMIETFPDFEPAYELLAEVEQSRRHLERAETLYARLVEVAPANRQALYMQALLMLLRGDVEAAAGKVTLFSARFPKDERAQLLTGMLAYARGDDEDGMVALHSSLKEKMRPLTTYFIGLIHFRQGSYEMALTEFQRVLDMQPESTPARLMLAMTFLRQQRFDDARQQVERVIARHPDSKVAQSLLGNLCLVDQDYDKALAAFSRALVVGPERDDMSRAGRARGGAATSEELTNRELSQTISSEVKLLSARLVAVENLLGSGKEGEAAQLLVQGLSGTSDDALIYRLMAVLAEKRGDLDQYAGNLRKALKVRPDWNEPRFGLAAYLEDTGEYREAIGEYREILAKDPGSVRCIVELGMAYELAGETAQAEQTFSRLAELERPESCFARARLLVRDKRVDEALTVLGEGLRTSPDALELVRLQVSLLREQGHMDQALRRIEEVARSAPGAGTWMLVEALVDDRDYKRATGIAEQVIRESPTIPAGYLLLARVQEAAQGPGKALETVRAGLARCPNHPDLLLREALLLNGAGDVEAALSKCRALLQAYPQQAAFQFTFATLNERRGDIGTAEQHYIRALEADENFLPALNNLANILAAGEGAQERALTLAFRAYRIAPFEPTVLDTLGTVLVRSERYRDAAVVLEQAHRLASAEPTICFHLGQAYAGDHQPVKARAHLEQALQLGDFPDSGACRELLARIQS